MPDHEPSAVEVDLAAYYDAEGDARLRGPIDEIRVTARNRLAQAAQPATVLEIGCGPGRDAVDLLARGWSYVGVDLSEGHLGRCRHVTAATVARASARHLPFSDEAFDAVWTMSTLMHIPGIAIEGALSEIARVVRPGGVAVIGVWGGPDVEHLSDRDPRHPRLFSRRSDATWRSLLARVGQVESFETAPPREGDFHYQLAVVRAPVPTSGRRRGASAPS